MPDATVHKACRRAARVVADRFGAAAVDRDFDRFTSTETAELFARVQWREVWATHGRWAARNPVLGIG